MSQLQCDADGTGCLDPLADVFDLLGRKYVLDVVCVIAVHGTVRFGDVEDHVPDASTSTLSARLDELEDAGWIRRERYDEIPPRVEYELTEQGKEVSERLRPLVEWAIENE